MRRLALAAVALRLCAACSSADSREYPPAPVASYAVRVTPPLETGLPVQDFGAVAVRGDPLDLSLSPSTIAGSIAVARAGTAVPYLDGPVTLSASGQSIAIPGLALPKLPSTEIAPGAGFAIPLSAGRWTVTVRAADRALPPVSTETIVTVGAHVDPVALLITDGLVAVQGVLLLGPETPWPESAPLWRFQVFEPDSLIPLSQVSEPVESGKPFVVMSLPATAYLLRATPEGGGGPWPSKDFASDSEGRFGTLVLGPVGDPIAVAGHVVDEQGEPVPSVEVQFEGRVGDDAVFQATAFANEIGEVAATLLPSATGYTIRLIPRDGPLARTSREGYRPEVNPAPVFTMAPRVLLSGLVADAEDRPVAGALVRLDPKSSGGGPIVVATMDNGRFEALVDPGDWRIQAQPPFASKLAWANRDWSTETGTSITLRLPRSLEASGTALYASGGKRNAIQGATVSFYRTSGGNPELVFETTTGADGGFRAFVPAP